jgi:stage IV sporulation protein FB
MIRFGKKIPLTIHPLFWVTAALIGFLNSQSLIGTLIWTFVILVSVIVHEMGHASTALFFGLKPRIELVALGGLTYHQGEKLPFWKQFLIVLNGPLFGFMLFLLAWILLKVPGFAGGLWGSILTLFFWVNLIWTVLNLVPVLPLDGGQLLRIGLEAFFGAKGMRYALITGMLVSGAFSLFFFLYQHFLIGALFFLFAFQSWDMFRKLRHLSEEDRSAPLKQALEAAEKDLQAGHKERALSAFEQIRAQSKEGMIHLAATQYLAFLKYDLGDTQEAYSLLKPIQTQLSTEALILLHKVAFDVGDYALVEEIGGKSYQEIPSKEIALRNALAAAQLSKEKPAVGWLETAFQEGLENIGEVAKSSEFDPIRQTEHFQKFIKHHQAS